MSCKDQASSNGGDCLEVDAEINPFDASSTAWLVGQAVRYLNTAGKEGELGYQRTLELLQQSSAEVQETVMQIFNQMKSGDAPLRWNLLYVLGDAGDSNAADFLVRSALKPLPEIKDDDGCESSRDMEMLVSTMAVHAIAKIAERYPEVSEHLLRIIAERPARPILIEAVKLASDLGLSEKVQELLPEDEHWILDIRRARTEELYAEPEREDGKERGFTPPKSGSEYTAPQVECCSRKER